MKKKTIKKLGLHKTTLSNLNRASLQRIKGGETVLDCVTVISFCTCGQSCELYSCFLACPTADCTLQGFTCVSCDQSCRRPTRCVDCETDLFICPL